jgi:hypothetical protein
MIVGKNTIRINRRGNEIGMHIVCHSEAMAIAILQKLETLCVEGVRTDLEREWSNQSQGGDRA